MKDGEYDIVVLGNSYAGHLASIEAGKRGFKVLHHAGRVGAPLLSDQQLERELFFRLPLHALQQPIASTPFSRLNNHREALVQSMARLESELTTLKINHQVQTIQADLIWEPANTFQIKGTGSSSRIKARGIILVPSFSQSPDGFCLSRIDPSAAELNVVGTALHQLEVTAFLENLGFNVNCAESECRAKALDPFFAQRLGRSAPTNAPHVLTIKKSESGTPLFFLPGVAGKPEACTGFQRDSYLESRMSGIFIIGAPHLERFTVERLAAEARAVVHNLALQLNNLVHTVGEVKTLPLLQIDPFAYPEVHWTNPLSASVGYTVEEAAARGFRVKIKTAQHPELLLGRPWLLETSSEMQFIADEETGCLHGVSVIGAHAEEIANYYRWRLSSTPAPASHIDNDVAFTGLL